MDASSAGTTPDSREPQASPSAPSSRGTADGPTGTGIAWRSQRRLGERVDHALDHHDSGLGVPGGEDVQSCLGEGPEDDACGGFGVDVGEVTVGDAVLDEGAHQGYGCLVLASSGYVQGWYGPAVAEEEACFSFIFQRCEERFEGVLQVLRRGGVGVHVLVGLVR
jgi:hypothetical protein